MRLDVYFFERERLRKIRQRIRRGKQIVVPEQPRIIRQGNIPLQWSVLKYFEPISLHKNVSAHKPKNDEEHRTLIDILWKVLLFSCTQQMYNLSE
jgi:hypothetical protein